MPKCNICGSTNLCQVSNWQIDGEGVDDGLFCLSCYFSSMQSYLNTTNEDNQIIYDGDKAKINDKSVVVNSDNYYSFLVPSFPPTAK